MSAEQTTGEKQSADAHTVLFSTQTWLRCDHIRSATASARGHLDDAIATRQCKACDERDRKESHSNHALPIMHVGSTEKEGHFSLTSGIRLRRHRPARTTAIANSFRQQTNFRERENEQWGSFENTCAKGRERNAVALQCSTHLLRHPAEHTLLHAGPAAIRSRDGKEERREITRKHGRVWPACRSGVRRGSKNGSAL